MFKPRLLALAVLLTASVAHAAGEPKPAKAPPDTAILAEATAAVDAFHKALKAGDKTAALALLDDSVEIFEQGGHLFMLTHREQTISSLRGFLDAPARKERKAA